MTARGRGFDAHRRTRPAAINTFGAMEYLDKTFATIPENLACEEMLLEECARGGPEVLRIWEPTRFAVVVGYGGQAAADVKQAACRSREVPVVRRHSGGGTVVLGPGCLNYAVVLRADADGAVSTIGDTNRFVMERNRRVLEQVSAHRVTIEGVTDLAVAGRKVSGNAQYRRRNAILFHGTFLVGMDLEWIELLTRRPDRFPSYRRDRTHRDFLTNLQVDPAVLRRALRSGWEATAEYDASRLESDLAQYARFDRPI